MKNVFSLFLAVLIFFVFSCAGTPKSDDVLSDLPQSDLIEEEVEETPEPEVLDTEQPDEWPPAEEFFEEEDEPEEIAETEEILPEEEIAAAELPEQDEIDVAAVIEAPPVAEPPVAEPEPPLEQAPVQPPVQIAQEPVPSPSPLPSLPPPGLPSITPALLGPAEEKPPAAERQPQERQAVVPFRRDSEREDSPPFVSVLKDEPPVPAEVMPQNGEIIFSRIVRATVGQILEIPFRGTGWVYLGELASRRGIVYNSRRIDPDGQSFIFRAEEAGTYALKFFKQDFIRDYILNDHVQVIVGESPLSGGAGWFNPPLDRGRVVAEPRWPSALNEAEIQRGGQPVTRSAAETPPGTQTTGESAAAQRTIPAQENAVVPETSLPQPPTAQAGEPMATTDMPPPVTVNDVPQAVGAIPEKQEILPPEELLQKAKETFDEGNVAAAIALLDQYREYYPSGSDELYWLYGQFYEANSPSRDILIALDYYRRLVREYPQSGRLSDARRRIAYLERFYINIQ